MDDTVKVFVVGEGIEVPISVHRNYTIKNLKNEIEKETGLGKWETVILFEGRPVDDNEETLLVSIGITDNDVLTIELSEREIARLDLLKYSSVDIREMLRSVAETKKVIHDTMGTPNEVEIIKKMTSAGIDHDRHLTLHIAIQKERHEVLKTLLELNADPNILNTYKETPLMVSCQNGNVTAVDILLSYNADIGRVNVKGWNALMESVAGNQISIVKILLQNGANVNSKRNGTCPISIAAKRGSLDMITLLLDFGCTLHFPKSTDCHPLLLASAEGHLDVVKFLVSNKVDVNVSDSLAWTPLTHASWSGHTDIVRYLINNNANVTAITYGGESVLAVANRAHHTDIVELVSSAMRHMQLF